MGRFKDRFQFPERVRGRRPTNEDKACHFFPSEICFYETVFTCGLRLPVHPFIMELLGFSSIAPRQLTPIRGGLWSTVWKHGWSQTRI